MVDLSFQMVQLSLPFLRVYYDLMDQLGGIMKLSLEGKELVQLIQNLDDLTGKVLALLHYLILEVQA